MRKQLLLKSMLLLCALIVGSTSVWAQETTTIATFDSDVAVTAPSYANTYGGEDWSINMGGNNKSIGFNNKNCVTIGDALGTSATATNYGIVVKSKNALANVNRITFVYTNGSGDGGKLYLASSENGTDWNAITLDSGDDLSKQGETVSKKTMFTFEFETISSAYYAFILDKGNTTTAAYRFDNVEVTFISVAGPTTESPLASIALSGTYPTTFAVGDEFSHQGMTVTATYEDESTYDVTSKATFSGYDMSSTGTQEVTVSYTEKEVTKTATYNITVKALANLAFSTSSQEIALGSEQTISFTKSTDADVYFEVGDETIATYDPLTGKVKGLKEGTTTITATSAETSDYAAGSATCTIKVIDPNWIDLTAQGYENADDVKTIEGVYGTLTFDIGTNSYNNPKWYDSGSAVRLYTGNTIKITAKTGFVLTDVEFSVTSGSMSKDSFSETVTNEGNKFTLSTPANEITYSTGSNFRINKVKMNIAAPVTITTAEYATFSSEYALDFSETGITVYTAEDKGTFVDLNEVTSGQVPANTPVVLHKADADGTAINVPVIASAEDIEGTNDLRVSTGTDVDYMYVLANKNNGVGFYKWAGTTDLSAGKVYLQGTASNGAREFLGFSEGEATGISATLNDNGEMTNDKVIFNLSGQRVAQPAKGLYIVNGKKVIVK